MNEVSTYYVEVSGSAVGAPSQRDLRTLLSELEAQWKAGEISGACVVEEASWLPSGIPWEGVIVSKNVMLEARTAYHWEELGALPLGGEMRTTFRLGENRSRTELVGREAELESLCDSLKGHNAISLSGGSGMGKSSLLDALRENAQAAGFTVISEVLRKGGNELHGEGDSPEDRAAFLLKNFIEKASGKKVLLVLDDVQWANEFQKLVITRLAGRVNPSFCLVLSSREVKELQIPQQKTITLKPLSIDALRNLIRLRAPELSAEDQLAETLFKQAGGHPLLSVEVLKACQRKRRLGQELEFSTIEGEDDLSKLAASLRNQEVPLGLAELAVLRLPFSKSFAEKFCRQLEVPFDLSVIENDDAITCGENLEFRHALIRRGVAQGLSPDREKAAHMAAASLLQEGKESDPAEAGYHLSLIHISEPTRPY